MCNEVCDEESIGGELRNIANVLWMAMSSLELLSGQDSSLNVIDLSDYREKEEKALLDIRDLVGFHLLN